MNNSAPRPDTARLPRVLSAVAVGAFATVMVAAAVVAVAFGVQP
ncbi:hypothetical protein [Leifsonia sp. SIMBA_070]